MKVSLEGHWSGKKNPKPNKVLVEGPKSTQIQVPLNVYGAWQYVKGIMDTPQTHVSGCLATRLFQTRKRLQGFQTWC